MKKASVEEYGSSVSKIGNIFNTKRETLMHEMFIQQTYVQQTYYNKHHTTH